MCLIFFAWRTHPDYPLVVAANRDEFYARPTAAAKFWEDAPEVLAGRDLEGGGTWLGVSRGGRFAALTNHRKASSRLENAPTRGRLVSDFLTSRASPLDYVRSLAPNGAAYNGFNLLVADSESLCWLSNLGGEPRRLEPGVYAISNDLLDTPWPKVVRGKSAFQNLLTHGDLDFEKFFDLLLDRQVAEDTALPDTGIGLLRERSLSPIFITAGDYGTRSSTVLLMGVDGGVEFEERTFQPGHHSGSDAAGTLRYAFRIESDREPVY
jgi:uncharacterized protein with NRDE domain